MVESLRCAIAALAVAYVGCEVGATQLLAVVNTDLAVPAEVDGVRLRVWSEGEAEPRLDRTIAPAQPDEALPASFGIAPRGRDATRRITVTADALLAGGTVVTTSAATTFLEHQALRLDLYLARGCRGVVCDDGETCRGGECEPVDLDPDRLPVFETGQDLGPAPPDEPPAPGTTVLLPLRAGTILTDLHLALAPTAPP